MLFTSPIYSQASGSTAGNVFSHNRYGKYTRARSTPVNPNSPTQQTTRMKMGEAANKWRNIAVSAREAWQIYASNTPWINRIGETVFLSGQAMAVRTWIAGMNAGFDDAAMLTAPSTFGLPDTGSLVLSSITASTKVVVVAVNGAPAWAANDDAVILIFGGMPRSQSVNFYGGPWRKIGNPGGNTTTPVTAVQGDGDAANPIITYAAGQHAWVACRVIEPNLAGTAIRVSQLIRIGPVVVVT